MKIADSTSVDKPLEQPLKKAEPLVHQTTDETTPETEISSVGEEDPIEQSRQDLNSTKRGTDDGEAEQSDKDGDVLSDKTEVTSYDDHVDEKWDFLSSIVTYFSGGDPKCAHCELLIRREEVDDMVEDDNGYTDKPVRFHKDCYNAHKAKLARFLDKKTAKSSIRMASDDSFPKTLTRLTAFVTGHEPRCMFCRTRIVWSELDEMVQSVKDDNFCFHKDCYDFMIKTEEELEEAREAKKQEKEVTEVM